MGQFSLYCFFELFDETIQEKLIEYINDYTVQKLAGVLPATLGSRFAKWLLTMVMTKYRGLLVLGWCNVNTGMENGLH